MKTLSDLDLFYGKVKFGNLSFSMGKSENSGFLETIAASDLKVGRCRQLIKFMKICEYWRSRSFLYHKFSCFLIPLIFDHKERALCRSIALISSLLL